MVDVNIQYGRDFSSVWGRADVVLLLLPKVRASVARWQKVGRCVVRSRADDTR
jgi:hypothetical protein